MMVCLASISLFDIRTAYNIPGQRMQKDSPLDILKKRLASREIKTEEYQEKKKILESDLAK